MFTGLTNKFEQILTKLGAKRRLTSSNIEEGIAEIRLALIEADVNLEVIKSFINAVKEKALGQEIIASVSSVNMFIKIVNDELIAAFGGGGEELRLLEPTRATSVLLCGLQGSGKTTTCGKLAKRFKEKRDIVLVSLDIYRPAANEQLKILAGQVGVDFYDRGSERNLKTIIKDVQKYAKKNLKNLIIFDTAGRTQLDASMLAELKEVHSLVSPSETILVCDSMTGQQALSVATQFKATVPLSALIFTKFDSDTRGGALLSVRSVVGAPVKYIGTGEKIEQFEIFSPERITERLLGKGDIVGLVEKAQNSIDEAKAEKLAQKIGKDTFDLQDFHDQLEQISNMGSLESVLSMVPGMGKAMQGATIDEKEFKRMQVIIRSMTRTEKEKPFLINNSRKIRIARGSGTNMLFVNQTLKKYGQMKDLMKKMGSTDKMMKMMNQMTGGQLDMETLNKLDGLTQGSQKGIPGLGGGFSPFGSGLPNMGGLNLKGGLPGFPGFPGLGKKK